MDPCDDPAAEIQSRLRQLNFTNWINKFELSHGQLRLESDVLLKSVVDSIKEACPQLCISMRDIISDSIHTAFTESCNLACNGILLMTEREARKVGSNTDMRKRWRTLDRLRWKFKTAVLGLLFPDEHPTTVDGTSSATDNAGLDSTAADTAAESVTTDAGFDSTVNDICEPISTESECLSDHLVENSNTSQQISSANLNGLDLLASASASSSAVTAGDTDITADHSSSSASSSSNTFPVICKAYEIVLNEQRIQRTKEGMTANELAGPLSVSNSYIVVADTQCAVKFGVTISTRPMIKKRYELCHFTIAASFLH